MKWLAVLVGPCEVAAACGAAGVGVGLGMIYAPMAWLWAGGALLFLAYRGATR